MRELVISKSLDFITIQETKIGEFSNSFVQSLWGNSFCDLSYSSSLGNSGSLLSIWCSSKGSSLFPFVDPGYLSVYYERE